MAAAGYIILQMKISDPVRYQEYMAAAPAVVKAAGGEYLVRGGRHETLEGTWNPSRVAVLRFPSFEAAKAFYNADAYRAVRAKRQGATEYFEMLLVEGPAVPV